MIGRHFLCYSASAPRVKRQYTICSSMNDTVRSALLELAQSVLDKKEIAFKDEVLLGQDQSDIDLTLKTYNMPKGLATAIHAAGSGKVTGNEIAPDGKAVSSGKDGMFYIKGPMGRGLQMKPDGQHVAFCAGTGVLVFLDLVSQLLLLNIFKKQGKAIPSGMDYFQPGFKFHLYVAFQDRKQSIGLDLIEALVDINKELGCDNFELTLRMADGKGTKQPRWNPEYVESELGKYAGQLKKVWVCGPPSLNQMFD